MAKDVMGRVAARNPEAAEKTGAVVPAPDMSEALANLEADYEAMLPAAFGGVTRFLRIALAAYRRTKGMDQVCRTKEGRASFLGAVMTCAQLGLPPGGPTGEAWILPFKQRGDEEDSPGRVAQFVLGAAGMATLFWRHPAAQYLQTEVIHANDEFDYEYGVGGYLHHKPVRVDDPTKEVEQRGPAVLWYAVAQLTSGAYTFKALDRAQVEWHRSHSKAPNSPAWKNFYDEMGKKSALRASWSRLPKSVEMATAVAVDESVRTTTDPDELDDLAARHQAGDVVDGEVVGGKRTRPGGHDHEPGEDDPDCQACRVRLGTPPE
jgi:recombination protein RecT